MPERHPESHPDLPHKPQTVYSDHPKAEEARAYYAKHADEIRAQRRARYTAAAATARKAAWRQDPDNAAHVSAYNKAYYKKRKSTTRTGVILAGGQEQPHGVKYSADAPGEVWFLVP